jgi:hypothetical protein
VLLDLGHDSASGRAALFPGEQDGDAVPVVSIDPVARTASYWLADGIRGSAEKQFSPKLRNTFFEPSVRWVAASEAATSTQFEEVGTALLIASDGTAVLDALARRDGRFELTVGDAAQPQTSLFFGSLPAAGPSPRSEFGATFSRLFGFLAILGGRLESGESAGDLWIFERGGWRDLPITAGPAPVEIEAMAFSWTDARLWVVERVPAAGRSASRRLLRINLAGQVASVADLSSLADHERVWLRAFDDGRMLLAAAKGDTHQLAILAGEAGANPRADACVINGGELLGSPFTRGLRVSGPVWRREDGLSFVSPEVLADFGATRRGSSCGLSQDLR